MYGSDKRVQLYMSRLVIGIYWYSKLTQLYWYSKLTQILKTDVKHFVENAARRKRSYAPTLTQTQTKSGLKIS